MLGKVPVLRYPWQRSPKAATAQANRRYDREKRDPHASALYASKEWQALRARHLALQPRCVGLLADGSQCGRSDRREVDHIRPHGNNLALFFDPANLQTLCRPCHSRKTGFERAAAKQQAEARA